MLIPRKAQIVISLMQYVRRHECHVIKIYIKKKKKNDTYSFNKATQTHKVPLAIGASLGATNDPLQINSQVSQLFGLLS